MNKENGMNVKLERNITGMLSILFALLAGIVFDGGLMPNSGSVLLVFSFIFGTASILLWVGMEAEVEPK